MQCLPLCIPVSPSAPCAVAIQIHESLHLLSLGIAFFACFLRLSGSSMHCMSSCFSFSHSKVDVSSWCLKRAACASLYFRAWSQIFRLFQSSKARARVFTAWWQMWRPLWMRNWVLMKSWLSRCLRDEQHCASQNWISRSRRLGEHHESWMVESSAGK